MSHVQQSASIGTMAERNVATAPEIGIIRQEIAKLSRITHSSKIRNLIGTNDKH